MVLDKELIMNIFLTFSRGDYISHTDYEAVADHIRLEIKKQEEEEMKEKAVMCVEEEIIVIEEPVHMMFGLSYASWLILPRVILESMPIHWQTRLVDLVHEMDEIYDWHPGYDMFVQLRDRGKIVKIPEHFNNYRRPDRSWLDEVTREQD